MRRRAVLPEEAADAATRITDGRTRASDPDLALLGGDRSSDLWAALAFVARRRSVNAAVLVDEADAVFVVAARLEDLHDAFVADEIRALRAAGVTWERIAAMWGLAGKQAAWMRYRRLRTRIRQQPQHAHHPEQDTAAQRAADHKRLAGDAVRLLALAGALVAYWDKVPRDLREDVKRLDGLAREARGGDTAALQRLSGQVLIVMSDLVDPDLADEITDDRLRSVIENAGWITDRLRVAF